MQKRVLEPGHRHEKKSRRPLKFHFSALEGGLFGIICASLICISTALIADASFDPVADAKHAMERLAKDYYVEFLYPSTLGSNLNNPSVILSRSRETGLPLVRLRQLLLYKDSAKATYLPYFSNEFYSCNRNATTIRYYPVEPYGPLDYKIEINPVCEDLRTPAE